MQLMKYNRSVFLGTKNVCIFSAIKFLSQINENFKNSPSYIEIFLF